MPPSRVPPIANVIAKDFHVTGFKEETRKQSRKEIFTLKPFVVFIYAKPSCSFLLRLPETYVRIIRDSPPQRESLQFILTALLITCVESHVLHS